MAYLTPKDLVERWQSAVTVKTLANWRCLGMGPSFTKVGGRIVYSLSDVLSWEASRRQQAGAQPGQRHAG